MLTATFGRSLATMVRMSVLADALKTLNNAEKAGKRQVLIRPCSKVIVKYFQVMQRHGEYSPWASRCVCIVQVWISSLLVLIQSCVWWMGEKKGARSLIGELDVTFACALCTRLNPGGTLARAPQAGDAVSMKFNLACALCMRLNPGGTLARAPQVGDAASIEKKQTMGAMDSAGVDLHARCARV